MIESSTKDQREKDRKREKRDLRWHAYSKERASSPIFITDEGCSNFCLLARCQTHPSVASSARCALVVASVSFTNAEEVGEVRGGSMHGPHTGVSRSAALFFSVGKMGLNQERKERVKQRQKAAFNQVRFGHFSGQKKPDKKIHFYPQPGKPNHSAWYKTPQPTFPIPNSPTLLPHSRKPPTTKQSCIIHLFIATINHKHFNQLHSHSNPSR